MLDIFMMANINIYLLIYFLINLFYCYYFAFLYTVLNTEANVEKCFSLFDIFMMANLLF